MAPHAEYTSTQKTAIVLCIATLVLTALFDALTPANLVVGMIYVVPLAVCVWVGSIRFLWSIAALAIASAIVFFFWGPPSTVLSTQMHFVNHILCVGMLLAFAALVHWHIRALQGLSHSTLALRGSVADLATANSELAQREQDITRQNEELQSQTEELERQSEELRVTNEELVNWEKTLEHLLQLAHALTTDLTRGEMLGMVCETLGLLSEGKASAIIEREGDLLYVSCHHGFGKAGVEHERYPAHNSFAALVMSLGQTGYLADVHLRPDVILPRPADGPAFRSVLSTPLRVQGRCVGTVEVYAHEPRNWAESDVAMVEAMGAQLSISLQSLALVEDIRHERRRFEAAFRTAPFGLVVAEDVGLEKLHVNPAAATMLGVPHTDHATASAQICAMLGKSFFSGDATLALHEIPLARAARGEDVSGLELEMRAPHGRHFSVLVSAAPLYDAQGTVVGAVSAFADISLQKSLLRQLEMRRREAEEASLRKTRFLAAVSHDIRTPANAINLVAELIRRDTTLSDELVSLAEELQANTRSLMNLIGDVLDIARFDTGKIELIENEFALAEAIADECRQLLPLAREKNLALEVIPLAQPIWLRTDRVKLARVLGNLIGNAIKFTPSGSVKVSAQMVGDGPGWLEIQVADTGLGIAREHLSNIFEEFAQLHNPARDSSKGSGLGLAICKRLIDVMGGEILVESLPGAGSTFTVKLPSDCVVMRLDSALRGPAAPANDGAKALPGLTVLLVEDHDSTRDGTARILRHEGLQVDLAASGAAAVEMISQDAHDVILLDMMLPDLDGRELLKSLQHNRPNRLRGVLVLTGDLTQQRRNEIKFLGADGLIEKPIDVEKLLTALRAFGSDGQQ